MSAGQELVDLVAEAKDRFEACRALEDLERRFGCKTRGPEAYPDCGSLEHFECHGGGLSK